MTIRIGLTGDIDLEQILQKYGSSFNQRYIENKFPIGICDNYDLNKIYNFTKYFPELYFKIYLFFNKYLIEYTINKTNIISKNIEPLDDFTIMVLEMTPEDITIDNEITQLLTNEYIK